MQLKLTPQLQDRLASEQLSINVIEHVTTDDIAGVVSVVRAASDYLVTRGFYHWHNYYTADKIAATASKGNTLLLKIDTQSVATVTLEKQPPQYYLDDNLMHYFSDAQAIYIGMLAVHPDWHGLGLAKSMIDLAEQYATQNQMQHLRLDARADYTELIELYQKLGFEIKGEIIELAPDDGIEKYYLMEKILS
jgi:ribosomal protein S18 acetylase RimI-like enzyme